jgi:HEAT repeat protein
MDDTLLESSRLLNASAVEDRLQAVRLLSGLRPVPVALYVQAFGDQDWRVRKEAVRIFLALADVQSFTADIIELLHDAENAGLRNSAIEILVSLGSLAVPALTAEITCPDPEVRKFAIDILGEIGGPGCAQGVLSALTDEEINVRYAAVETLGKLALESAAQPLLDLMDDADTGLRFTILEALSAIGKDVSIARLSRFLNDRVLRKALLDCFGRLGGVEVLPYLVEGLTDPLRKVRETSLRSLGRLAGSLPEAVKDALHDVPDDLTERLIEQLHGPSVETQRAAIRLLALSGGHKAARSLLPLLEDEQLREEVVAAFRAQHERFFAQLLDAERDPAPMTELCLIYLAGELGHVAGLQPALDALHSRDPQHRYAAAVTLGKIGHRKAIAPLVELLKDESPDICDAAASALARFDRQSFEAVAAAVTPLLVLPDAAVRMRAVRVLASADRPRVASALLMALKDPAAEVRCEAIKALRGCGAQEYSEALTLALTDEVADVRRLSAAALGTCPAEQALPALALAVDDQDPWVRAAAVRALTDISDPQAEPLLLQAANDPVGLVVIAALETLRARAADAARSRIEKALSHPDEEVVKAAIDLLARDGGCDCLQAHGLELFTHPQRDVRLHALQVMARLCGEACCRLIEQRLPVEKDALLRQALQETLIQLQRSGS